MLYKFGDYVVDTDKHELLRGNQRVKLRNKPFELLTYLVANAGQALSKQQLLDHVWLGRIISDATLNSSIKETRQAIGYY